MPEDHALTEENEVELRSGTRRARVAAYGASLRGSWTDHDGSIRQIITWYSRTANKVGGQGDVLIPFPGRIRAGRYMFDGHERQLACNDKDGPNAIHGFLRAQEWSVVSRTESNIQFCTVLDADAHEGYPYSLHASVSYEVEEGGLKCRYEITNTGSKPAPCAAGFHPYFSAGGGFIDDCTLELPFTEMLEFENLLPTGRSLPVKGTEFDFTSARWIGPTQLNTCFLNPIREDDGLVKIRLSSSGARSKITVWADRALNYVVLYSGDPLPEPHRRRSLAIEPMTCGSDAFNHPNWGLVPLMPGKTMAGSWGVLL